MMSHQMTVLDMGFELQNQLCCTVRHATRNYMSSFRFDNNDSFGPGIFRPFLVQIDISDPIIEWVGFMLTTGYITGWVQLITL